MTPTLRQPLFVCLDGLAAAGERGARWLAELIGRSRGAPSVALSGAATSPERSWLARAGRDFGDFDESCLGAETVALALARRLAEQPSFAIVASVDDLELLARTRPPGSEAELVTIGLASSPADGRALERAGASFVVLSAGEAVALARTAPHPASLSLVLMAYNERATIDAAIADARRFGALYFAGGAEVVVVDDGSTDGTAERLAELDAPDLRVVTHAQNLGMGATVRDGLAAAGCDFVAPFPADRQVRPQALIPFLPLLSAETAGVGTYDTPHAGGLRALLSAGFRANRRWVGGLRVPFDGTYCFHRVWLERIDPRLTRAQSFVYGYELLEQLRRAGCELVHRPVRPFPREAGASKVANLRRIGRVFRETVASRLRAELLLASGIRIRLVGRGRGGPS